MSDVPWHTFVIINIFIVLHIIIFCRSKKGTARINFITLHSHEINAEQDILLTPVNDDMRNNNTGSGNTLFLTSLDFYLVFIVYSMFYIPLIRIFFLLINTLRSIISNTMRASLSGGCMRTKHVPFYSMWHMPLIVWKDHLKLASWYFCH